MSIPIVQLFEIEQQQTKKSIEEMGSRARTAFHTHTQWHKYNSIAIIVRLCPDIISTMRHQQKHNQAPGRDSGVAAAAVAKMKDIEKQHENRR